MSKPTFIHREVIVFRRFRRKGYALFACLGREVVIGVLSAFTLTHATAKGISIKPIKADTIAAAAEKEMTLGEVSVTGTRAPLSSGRSVRMVSVLTRADIAATPAQSVNDLLKLVAGVDVRQRGPLGAQTDVSIRGGNNEQIAILLNGINICDPQTAHNSFDFPVSISEIERIEVIKGPAGRLYGTSSLTGAINIVTSPTPNSQSSHSPTNNGVAAPSPRERAGGEASLSAYNGVAAPSPRERAGGEASLSSGTGGEAVGASASLSAGSYGYAAASARVAMASRTVASSLSGSYTRSDGYSRNRAGGLNADYSGGKAFFQGRYVADAMAVRWHAGMSLKGYGSNTFYGASWDDQYEHTLKTFTALQAEAHVGGFRLRSAVYWNHGADRFELFRGSEDKSPFNYHRHDVMGVNVGGFFDSPLGRTAIGAELRNEDLVSTTLGEPLSRPHHISGTDRHYGYGLNRTSLNFMFEHNLTWRGLTLSAGLVAARNTWSDMNFRIYPGVDVGYAFGRGFSVYASYSSSLRMPSATELYYSVGGHKADKHLRPEELSAIEGGLRYASGGVEAKAAVYHNHYSDMIDWVRTVADGPDAPWRSVNFTEINALGLEASLRLSFLRLIPSQRVLRSLGVDYSYISQSKANTEGLESKYSLEYLRHKLVATLGFNLAPRLTLDVNCRWHDRTGTYTATDGTTQAYSPYAVADARLAWTVRRLRLYLEANNLLGTSYVDYGNVPQPGFWFIARAAIELKIKN